MYYQSKFFKSWSRFVFLWGLYACAMHEKLEILKVVVSLGPHITPLLR